MRVTDVSDPASSSTSEAEGGGGDYMLVRIQVSCASLTKSSHGQESV